MKKTETLSILLSLLILCPIAAQSDTSNGDSNSSVETEWTIYGALNVRQFDYFKNAQDTSPRRRRETDLERLVFEPEIEFTENWKLEAEIEFEHGGTGSTLEFDGFEEFGEFETETEQGGAVKVDKLELAYDATTTINYRFGFITVPVGVISQRHHPTEYFTTTRNRSEAKILPSTWRSMGFGLHGTFGEGFDYQAVVVQGLNSEFFRKYNWIKNGANRAFETTYADDLAYALRLDYGANEPYRKIGASVYYGNSSQNRHKTDKLTADAGVLIWDVHAIWESETWTFRALYLYGYLQNSEDISAANATLGGAANPGAFAALGKEAEASFTEIGYNLQALAPALFSVRTDAFIRYDSVDPMKATADTIYSDPRFKETALTAGLNFKPRPELVAKIQYSQIRSGLAAIPIQTEITAGLGFYYSTEN